MMKMTGIWLLGLSVGTLAFPASAQSNEGALSTQALVRAESKSGTPPSSATINLQVNSKATPITSLVPVLPGSTQVALLIDDGLSRGAGIQLNDLRDFANSLPPTTELLVGYMANGRVMVDVPFTTDHAAAAAKIRTPAGIPGESASPYFCLSDFVQHWPGAQSGDGYTGFTKARFVIMLTNGVDPYNGSDRIANQDSPYVQKAIYDSQRAGVAVSSIYYRDAGFRGGNGSLSGSSYLQQVADSTGGELYYSGPIDPVSIKPYLTQFEHSIAETYIATFNTDAQAGGREHLVRLKMTSTVPKLKLRHPDEVRPGNMESAGSPSARLMPPGQ